MEYVILDLEWNGTFSKKLKGFFNEIIEFGAVKLDDTLRQIDTFSMFVRPQIGKKISTKVKNLTNISSADLDLGAPFTQVLSKFRHFLGGAVLMTWGTSDILALMENNRYYTGSDRLPFLAAYVDLQNYCERRLSYESGKQMGLSTAAQLLGIDEEGIEHHRALDDSLLSGECMRKLYEKETLKEFIQDAAEDEFYRRISFKTVILCDLNHPLVRSENMNFVCELCGGPARQTGEWELKSKSYRAVFWCEHCQHEFIGRIQFKLKYEGLVVKKKTMPLKQEQPQEEPEAESEEIAVKESQISSE